MQKHYWFLLIFFALTQAVFIFLRKTLTGVSYYRLVRIHSIVIWEFFMMYASVFIWKRLSNALSSLGPTELTPQRFRWRTICAQDVAKAVIGLFLVLSQISFAFYFIFLGSEPNVLAIFSLTALAAYLHVFIFLLLAEALHYFCRLLIRFNVFPESSKYIASSKNAYSLLAALCAFLFIAGGLYTTFRDPVYTRATVHLPKIEQGDSDISIALLTDIHIGPTVGKHRMETIVRLTNALNSDIIAISGDLADGFVSDLNGAAAPLCELRARHGVYFATGNHEYMHGNVEEWFSFLRNCNITVLHNENKRIVAGDHNMCISGVDDIYAAKAHMSGHEMNPERALKGCQKNDINVLLAHQPNAAKTILQNKSYGDMIDLILSGHTHGGQMYLFMPIVYAVNAFARGLYWYESSNTFVYVSAGVNFFGPPIKMFGACEIIEITLTSQ